MWTEYLKVAFKTSSTFTHQFHSFYFCNADICQTDVSVLNKSAHERLPWMKNNAEIWYISQYLECWGLNVKSHCFMIFNRHLYNVHKRVQTRSLHEVFLLCLNDSFQCLSILLWVKKVKMILIKGYQGTYSFTYWSHTEKENHTYLSCFLTRLSKQP